MSVRNLKPTSPASRFLSYSLFESLDKVKPEKSLLASLQKSGGRNNLGRITSRHRGGGHKRRYRVIDFKRDKEDVDARLTTLEYDPNRSAWIALLFYSDGEKRYIIAPKGVKKGDLIQTGGKADIKPGNCLRLQNIPVGENVHNIELKMGHGGQMARSAGSFATLVAREGGYATLRLPSGEMRKVRSECKATIGVVSNSEHENLSLGKAGRSRWLGIRPQTRGIAMNPVDHPMGGGEGVVVGRNGEEVGAISQEIAKITGKDVKIDVVEIRKPEIHGQLIADTIASQLEGRIAFKRSVKHAMQQAERGGCLGIKVQVAGRLGGIEIARTEHYKWGKVPLHTLRANIDYAESTAFTVTGTVGVKVWVYKGEIIARKIEALEEEEKQKMKDRRTNLPKGRNRPNQNNVRRGRNREERGN
ncbi:hypothetical protein CHS0354_023761 [Potamilus streckersoni]|uniref:Large ribosomal subunit protein uL2 n=1 Tax=Potamilus streckersoni TaxID=2493646 RepID=A0AAE0RYY3_9BIVA|nr:hypothetical protein CHS0354_023761 [Potamilus streckersoni]